MRRVRRRAMHGRMRPEKPVLFNAERAPAFSDGMAFPRQGFMENLRPGSKATVRRLFLFRAHGHEPLPPPFYALCFIGTPEPALIRAFRPEYAGFGRPAETDFDSVA